MSAMASILSVLQSGLPVLLSQFLVTLVLLGLGIFAYTWLTPFHEWRLVREEGNIAAGVLVLGTLIALSLPLAATLASSLVVLDIVVWGVVALVIQLIAFVVASRLLRDVRRMVENGNVAAALVVVGIQLAIAILNAGAMAG
jgi:putative membrane protein